MGSENKKKALSCMQRGPGPRYKLKTLTGFDDHDPSKTRCPAYSIRIKPKAQFQFTTPGPYSFPLHLNQHGPEKAPAYTMAHKPRSKFDNGFPGPGAHAPERGPLGNHQRRAPAYTMRFRHDKLQSKIGPGPIYMLPSCIGPEIPDIRAEPGYSMCFKRKYPITTLGPGPATYESNLNVVKKKCPAYSMKFRRKEDDRTKSPGPQYYYNIELIKRRQPKYTFGVRYSPCMFVGLVDGDD